jgi:AcrR family transcriptional regulator
VSAPTKKSGRSLQEKETGSSKHSSPRYSRLPVENQLSSLPPTAQRILSASRRILATDGLRALTIDAIVREAGVNRAAIRYYFGNKAGLLAAVVDSLIHDTAVMLVKQSSGLAAEESRIEVFVNGVGKIATDTDAYAVFFNILCEAIRDDDVRERVAELYQIFREENLRWVGADGPQYDGDRDALATLLVAVADGLGVQHFLGRDSAATNAALALFGRMLRPIVDESADR